MLLIAVDRPWLCASLPTVVLLYCDYCRHSIRYVVGKVSSAATPQLALALDLVLSREL